MNLPSPFWALRESFREGYRTKDLVADLQAGLVVGIVAIPLALALAIASGAPPQNGLYTALVAGGLSALFGGSRHQVTGPTAAFVVLLVPIVNKFGLSGLLVTSLTAGIIILGMAVARLGEVVRFVPHPVTTGFTSGIAITIALIQVKDFLGLQFQGAPDTFVHRLEAIGANIGTFRPLEAAIGGVTLAVLLFCLRFFKRTPAPIVAVLLVTVLFTALHNLFPSISFATVGNRFSGGVPQGLPAFEWPWQAHAPGGFPVAVTYESFIQMLPSAFSVAFLAVIETLLSATVAEGMTRKKYEPNSELLALGMANIVGPFFGSIPATGAIARTTTNIRFGAKSPIAAIIHAGVIFLVLASLAPLANYLPMAALAALLLFVAYNMSEVHHFRNILRAGEGPDRAVLLTCFILTVVFDMTVGVSVGVVLASLLFIQRMANLTESRPVKSLAADPTGRQVHLPSSMYYFEINGPMFFGAAHRATEAIAEVSNDVRAVILNLARIHAVDITGLVALRSAVENLERADKDVYLIVPDGEVREKIRHVFEHAKRVRYYDTEFAAVHAAYHDHREHHGQSHDLARIFETKDKT